MQTPLKIGSGLIAIGIVVLGALGAPRLRAQDSQATGADPTFEVASVKANKSGEPFVMMGGGFGQYNAKNVMLQMLIVNAYQIQPSQLVGGPKWITQDRFDIVAKYPEGAMPTQQPAMLRALLADRFKLVVHNEQRELPIYALLPVKGDGTLGPRMKPTTVVCAGLGRGRAGLPPPAPGGGGAAVTGVAPPGAKPGAPNQQCANFMAPGNLNFASTSMAQFAQFLSQNAGRIVVDKTGLTGNYELKLEFTPAQMPQGFGGGTPPPGAPPLPPIDPDGPSLFTALQEQLGLKLESQRAPVDVLVIDSVDHPTED